MNLWHRHKWADWVVTDRGVIWDVGFGVNQRVGWYLTQQRHCLTCGKTEIDDKANYGGSLRAWCTRKSDMAPRSPRKDGVSA